jgi:hypothetical protein
MYNFDEYLPTSERKTTQRERETYFWLTVKTSTNYYIYTYSFFPFSSILIYFIFQCWNERKKWVFVVPIFRCFSFVGRFTILFDVFGRIVCDHRRGTCRLLVFFSRIGRRKKNHKLNQLYCLITIFSFEFGFFYLRLENNLNYGQYFSAFLFQM